MKRLIVLVLLSTLASCGQKKSSGPKQVNQIFVKGNPLTMISDTDADTTSFITTSNFDDFNGFHLSGINGFTEKEFITEKPPENIEEGNEAETEDQTQERRETYNFIKDGAKWTLTDSIQSISLTFNEVNTRLNLKELKIGKSIFPVEALHYSVSPDKSKMSFLMKFKTAEDGAILFSAAFAKGEAKATAEKVSDKFFYLLGPGVKVPFAISQETINVTVCNNASGKLGTDLIYEAIKAWETPLKRARPELEINLQWASRCKPFSDVNEHSVQYIDQYLTVMEKDHANPAFAMFQTDFSNLVIFDSDIIILGSELAKADYPRMYLKRFVSHEFGHFLGLHHQFEDVPSIMSYEDYFDLKLYDHEAIFELYKE